MHTKNINITLQANTNFSSKVRMKYEKVVSTTLGSPIISWIISHIHIRNDKFEILHVTENLYLSLKISLKYIHKPNITKGRSPGRVTLQIALLEYFTSSRIKQTLGVLLLSIFQQIELENRYFHPFPIFVRLLHYKFVSQTFWILCWWAHLYEETFACEVRNVDTRMSIGKVFSFSTFRNHSAIFPI